MIELSRNLETVKSEFEHAMFALVESEYIDVPGSQPRKDVSNVLFVAFPATDSVLVWSVDGHGHPMSNQPLAGLRGSTDLNGAIELFRKYVKTERK